METITVIGAGGVGRALGAGLAAIGHTVRYGVRDTSDERHRDLGGALPLAAACADTDLVVLAVPAMAVPDVVPALGLRAGQTVIDATNAVRVAVPGGFPTMGALVGSLLPSDVGLAKAFNTIGAEHMRSGRIGEQRVFLPIAGDPDAAALAQRLAEAIGFEAVVLGGREQITTVEAHAQLWIQLAFGCGWGRQFAFSVART